MTSRPRHGSHVDTRVARSERQRRWATMLGVLTLIALAVLPVAMDHAPTGLAGALAGFDHVGALCLAALHLLLAPIHGGFHVVLGAGLAYAIWDRARAWRKLSRVLAPLEADAPLPGSAIWTAAVAAGVRPEIIRVVAGLPNPAFTVGMWSPRIYIAAALPHRLSAGELQAVIGHEAAHVERRDPLRLSLLRALACTLFWMPALARLAEDIRDDSEIMADDVAAARGQSLVLASAILSIAAWPGSPIVRGAVGFCHGALLERRVRRLLGEDVAVRTHLTGRSLAVALLALTLPWTSGVVMTHPLATAGGTGVVEAHCEHEAESPLAHLFCRSRHAADCPHAARVPTGTHEHAAQG